MKRIVSVLGAAAVCALVATALALAASGKDYSGGPCYDLAGGAGNYATVGGKGSGGNAVLTWSGSTAAATCSKATYTLYVLAADGAAIGDPHPVAGGTSMACPTGGTSTSCLSWTVNFGPATTAPQSICIYGTSSFEGKIYDRGPDADCIGLVLDPDVSGGGGGFN